MLSNLLSADVVMQPIVAEGATTAPIIMEAPANTFSIVDAFMAGGWWGMAAITLTLVCALFAAWKAPAWVQSLGKVAIAIGVISFLLGISDIAQVIQENGDRFPFSVYIGGVKVALIAPIYGIIVYVIITLVDLVRRPRISEIV
ncbi:MAG: hypothetical protein IKA01_06710 [Alistipes sp.]|nr:hypothetical protein [Alistipes sp.]